MITNDKFNELVDRFFDQTYNVPHSRALSYDHLRDFFIKNRKDETKRKEIALHLYTYLASWGMLKNSFLMDVDYLFNLPIVDVLCSERYDSLLDFDIFNDDVEEKIDILIELIGHIKMMYTSQICYDFNIGSYKAITNVSNTLITKIILGTFGCSIALDTYVNKALSKLNIQRSPSKKMYLQLIEFAKQFKNNFNKYVAEDSLYTQMKILDMFLFEYGYECALDARDIKYF